MLLYPFVAVHCTNKNKKLLDLGYDWKLGEYIIIKVEHLPPSSAVRVVAYCDYCWEQGKYTRITPKYHGYRRHNLIRKDACKRCARIKGQDFLEAKYGKRNASQIDVFKEKSAQRQRKDYESVETIFKAKNCILLQTDYKNKDQKLSYLCEVHPEKGVQQKSLRVAKSSVHPCPYCAREATSLRMSNSGSPFWKGGITPISLLLRSRLRNWKLESIKANGFRCVLTGKREDIHIHHLHSFNLIVKEAFEELGLPIYEDLQQYQAVQLDAIIETFLKIHAKYPLGIPICENLHDMFHQIYGDEVVPGDFNHFAREKYKKEIQPVSSNGEKLQFYPYKIKATSKYTGVSLSKNSWRATLTFGDKKIQIGSFETEYDAAKAYNDKVIALFGENATINLLDPQDLNEDYHKQKGFFRQKHTQTSRFVGVVALHGKFRARLTDKNKGRHHLGTFDTEVEAAYHYNMGVKRVFGENAKLNFLTPEEINEVELKLQANCFPHKSKGETVYTCVFKRDGKWESFFYEKNQYHYIGVYPTDKEAAIAYNEYVKKNGIERKLNSILN